MDYEIHATDDMALEKHLEDICMKLDAMKKTEKMGKRIAKEVDAHIKAVGQKQKAILAGI